MRTYAVSIGDELTASPEFEGALRSHALRNIEFIGTAQNGKKLEMLQKEGLVRVESLHLPFWPFDLWQYTAEDETARRETVRITLEYLESFTGLNIPNITIHCGGEPNLPEERQVRMERMIRTCRDLQPLLERWNASLNLELLPRTCIGNHEDELLEMVSQLPERYFNLCIDVNHLMGRWREIPAVIRKCAPRIRSMHISDYDGVDECHWLVGHGVIPWTEVAAEIKALKQDVLLITETDPLKTPRNSRPVNPSLRLASAEQDCIRLEYSGEWGNMRTRLWPETGRA